MPALSPRQRNRRVPPARCPLGLSLLPTPWILVASMLAAGTLPAGGSGSAEARVAGTEQARAGNPGPPRSWESPPTGSGRPEPPLPGIREVATEIIWTEGSAREFTHSRGRTWRVVPETAVTGWLVRPGERRAIHQTRLRIEDQRKGKQRVLAWLQHTANTEVSILRPGDGRLGRIGAAIDDSLRPWPNACSVMLYELDHSIDLNRNGRMELPIRSSVSLPDPSASLLLFLEADDHGLPRLVPKSEFVGTVRFEEGIITSARFQKGMEDPVLEAQWLPLYQCRFLARLQIPGEEACRNCCMIPMVLRRDEDGFFRPAFDKTTQGGLLKRFEAEVAALQQGGPGPLTPPEMVALARAASFLYLTGVGGGTREQLEKALGPRARLPRTAQLLDRLDRFFLAPAHPGGL